MTSTRLPGKVLADLEGRPMLSQQLNRLRAMREADEIRVATTALATDDPVEELCRSERIPVFRGDEQDVLSRFLGAARASNADLVVRVTADCPLIDPGESDRVVRELLDREGEADYASNVQQRSYPRGLDTEAFFRDALERMGRRGRSQKAREHVTWFMHRERPDLFSLHSVADARDNSDLRWTVDTAADLEMVRRLYRELDLGRNLRPYREILAHVRAHPEIAAMNREIAQKDA